MSDLIPRITEPISAYDLLTKVCEVITEEPKRYNQELYLINERWEMDYENLPAPACGTICCVAGWVEALRGAPLRGELIGWNAREALGLVGDQGAELFGATAIDNLFGESTTAMRGTPEYAALGVQHIRDFQEKYADQLKAKIVEPVR